MEQPAKRILLAEDDRFLRRAAEAALKRAGFTVLAAADGEEALRMVMAEKPDLVLLDLIMPKLQGFEVLKVLKADPATASIPVVVLSNLGQDGDVLRALAAGAAAVLAYVGGDRQLLDELLAIFLEDDPAHLEALRDAVTAADPAGIMRAAHTLGGSLRVLGAAAAIALVGQLEALGREGRFEGSSALLARLEPELARVRGAAVEAIAGERRP